MPQKRRYPRHWEWPGQAKIAMSVGLALEAFRNRSQLTLEARPGHKDHFSLSYAEYGARAGVWRILDFLAETGIPATMSVNGKAAELYPEVVRSVADAGHEIAGHGWENDVLTDDANADSELDEIRKVTAAITRAAGVRPIGWTSPGSAATDNTLELLALEGYLWNGDEANDDLPYVHPTANGPMVVMPRVNTYVNDLVMWVLPKNSPNVLYENFVGTFDQLYAEGCDGSPKWIEIVLHCHFGGRPTLMPTARKCVEYAKRHEGLWFARKGDIARWALERDGGRSTA